ncbi:MAG: ester cyclase [Candidatus Promineifilaceae bacterium]|nr:ester cyclase [Candidatus Promineifilaceae bacterium]
MSDEYKAKWELAVEAWMNGNLDALDDVYSANVAYHLPPFPDMDLAGLKEFIVGFRMAFPDFQVVTDEHIVEGDSTAHRWHASGTFTGESPLLPVSPTNQPSTASGSLVCHWAEGKMIEVWHNGDWLGWLQRAGVIPPLG